MYNFKYGKRSNIYFDRLIFINDITNFSENIVTNDVDKVNDKYSCFHLC